MKILNNLLAPTIIAATVLAACGSTTESEPTIQKGDGWQIEFPGEVKTSTQDANGVSVKFYIAQNNGDAYSIAEFTVPAGTSFDLDGGVDGAIQGMGGTDKVASAELVSSEPITTPDGSEGRAYQATITGDDGKTATTNGVIVNHNDIIVHATMLDVDTDNSDSSAAFLDALQFS